jgi:flagellar hook-basal body complex protein FliE
MLDSISAPSLSSAVGAARNAASVTPQAGVSAAASAEPGSQDFASVLGQMALDGIGAMKAGETTALAGVRGEASVQQVVEAVMAAEQTLQAGISIRDKVVAAYLELSRMAI